jgi:NADH-quinone oxidoreductase subunit G
MIRNAAGVLEEASWPEALAAAAKGLTSKKVGVLVGGRATVEDAYAYSKFARVSLNTNNIDFRSRVNSDEELDFLANVSKSATYADIDKADQIVLLGFEPEDESPIVFLRIYKQFRKRALKVTTLASFTSRGSEKLNATVIKTVAGGEVAAINAITGLTPKTVVLIGERLAESVGALSAAVELANKSSAKVGYVPRRAGDAGAISAGALPNLLPGGRLISDAVARVDVAAAWGVQSLPSESGLSINEIVGSGTEAVLVGGVDPFDFSVDAKLLLSKKFVVSLEIRESDITDIAQVILPVAAVVEKSGSFMDWQGKVRQFDAAVESLNRSDLRILSMLADQMGKPISLPTVTSARKEIETLGNWDGTKAAMKSVAPSTTLSTNADEAILSSWRNLLDKGSLQEGEDNLAGTARPTTAVISKSRAERLQVKDGELIRVSNSYGAITLPCTIADIDDQGIWLPRNSINSQLIKVLGTVGNSVVKVGKA